MKKIVIFIGICCVLCGCSKDDKLDAAEQPVTNRFMGVKERMADTNYVAALQVQRTKQKALADKLAAAKTVEEKKAAAAELEQNRQESMAIIRQKMTTGR